MNALYFLFSAVIVVISAAMLLTERLRLWKYLLMMAYIFFISYTASIWGQIMGVPAIAGISFLVMILSKEYKVENACFACIGYLSGFLPCSGRDTKNSVSGVRANLLVPFLSLLYFSLTAGSKIIAVYHI